MFSCAIPLVTLVTLFTNILAVRVLLTRQMLRSATNIILLAIAIAHTLASTAPLPFTLQAHTFGGKHDFLPYGWACGYFSSLAFWSGTLYTSQSNKSLSNSQTNSQSNPTNSSIAIAFSTSIVSHFQTQDSERPDTVSNTSVVPSAGMGDGLCLYTRTVLADLVPIASHTASAWLMVLLAFQRYLHVCHPFASAHRLLAGTRVRIISVLLSTLAFASHVSVLAESEFTPRLVESLLEPGRLFVGVVRSERQWLRSEDWRSIYKVCVRVSVSA